MARDVFLSQSGRKERHTHGIDGAESRRRRNAREVLDLDWVGILGETSSPIEKVQRKELPCDTLQDTHEDHTIANGVQIGLERMKDEIEGRKAIFFGVIEGWRRRQGFQLKDKGVAIVPTLANGLNKAWIGCWNLWSN